MVYIANSVQWVVAFWGSENRRRHRTVSPIYTSHEIAYMIQDSGAAHRLHGHQLRLRQRRLAKTGPNQVIVTNLTDLLPVGKGCSARSSTKYHRQVGADAGGAPLPNAAPACPHRGGDPDRSETDLSTSFTPAAPRFFQKGPRTHIGMTSYVNDVTEDVAAGTLWKAATPTSRHPFFTSWRGVFMAIGLNKGTRC